MKKGYGIENEDLLNLEDSFIYRYYIFIGKVRNDLNQGKKTTTFNITNFYEQNKINRRNSILKWIILKI